jgi:[acyl-carrier-protein] S-malonyltransferase
MSTTAVLFPGQGSLTDDARSHAHAMCPELVERAETLVGADPFERAGESTRFAQPAVFLASLAGWRELQEPDPVASAGHSLGELSALAAAGVLDEHDALELVVLRGQLMADAAASAGAGGMAALLGVGPAQVAELASRHDLVIANDNAPGQLVLSGSAAGIDAAIAEARTAKGRVMRLDVAAAFHSPAMEPAVAPFRRAVGRITLGRPRWPVVSGLTGQVFDDIAGELADALIHPVRWRAVMRRLTELGASEWIDVGPGRVLARLADRNVPKAARVSA